MSEFEKIGDDPEVQQLLTDLETLRSRLTQLPGTADEQVCPYCNGDGYIISEDDVQVCRCLREKQSQRLFPLAAIPSRYRRKDLDSFKADTDDRRQALRRTRRFCEEFVPGSEKSGLFLSGTAGTGKTHLAVGVLQEFLHQGRSGLFCDCISLMNNLRKQAGQAGLDEQARSQLEKIYTVDLLVLDDLGAGRLSDFVREQVYSIIDHRYSENLALVVTSNLPLEELISQISYPVYSRIFGMCEVVHTGDTQDFRVPAKPLPPRRRPPR